MILQVKLKKDKKKTSSLMTNKINKSVVELTSDSSILLRDDDWVVSTHKIFGLLLSICHSAAFHKMFEHLKRGEMRSGLFSNDVSQCWHTGDEGACAQSCCLYQAADDHTHSRLHIQITWPTLGFLFATTRHTTTHSYSLTNTDRWATY